MLSVQLASGKQFSMEGGELLLNAASKAGVLLPYSCKTGRCGACKCKVISGITSSMQEETGLTDIEKSEGWILSCVRTSDSNLILEVEDLGAIALPPAKMLPCRISALDKLAPDVIRVLLRLPPTAEFRFIPGQYIDIIGPGGMRRSYSLANASFSNKVLELHIRAVPGGAMSDYWFHQARIDDLLRLNGPLGTFFLRDVADADLIFLATGTGIAPVKAILESICDLSFDQQPKSVTVVWGGRTRDDLYIDTSKMPGDHLFIPVLSRAGSGWSGSVGYVQDVILSTKPDLGDAAVYACGSAEMIRDAKEVLVQAGLPQQRFYSDAFVCSATNTSN